MNYDRFITAEQALIAKADAYAEKAHAEPRPNHPNGQLRRYTDDPYIVHPRAVAKLVYDAGLPYKVVAAALLHDVVEDTNRTQAELSHEFGGEIASLVWFLTDANTAVWKAKNPNGNRDDRKAEDLERLASAPANAQSIKCADLIDNTASIVARDPDFAVRYLREKRAILERLTRADLTLGVAAWHSLLNGEKAIGRG